MKLNETDSIFVLQCEINGYFFVWLILVYITKQFIQFIVLWFCYYGKVCLLFHRMTVRVHSMIWYSILKYSAKVKDTKELLSCIELNPVESLRLYIFMYILIYSLFISIVFSIESNRIQSSECHYSCRLFSAVDRVKSAKKYSFQFHIDCKQMNNTAYHSSKKI